MGGAFTGIVPIHDYAALLGVIDLWPLNATYFPILDGLGLFGSPNPIATVPANGHFQVSFAVPPFWSSGLEIQTQTVELAYTAPNGFCYISNVDAIVIP